VNLGSGNEALGQIAAYAWHIGNNLPRASKFVALLFDKTEFWKIDCLRGSPTSVTKCKWTDKGSMELLRNAPLKSPWTSLLNDVRSRYDLKLEPGSFLGYGASGRVFRFTNHQGVPHAVKIVIGSQNEIGNLQDEYNLLTTAHAKCPEHVIGVEGTVVVLPQGAALVLSQVGLKLQRKDYERIICSLQKLHAKGIIHGATMTHGASTLCTTGTSVLVQMQVKYGQCAQKKVIGV
jgi:hypothetical protein